jgi:hypothetical protein
VVQGEKLQPGAATEDARDVPRSEAKVVQGAKARLVRHPNATGQEVKNDMKRCRDTMAFLFFRRRLELE